MVNKSFWNNRKVLITGHTGFKGSWLMEILIFLGAKPYGIALNPIIQPSLFNDLRLSERVNNNIIDIRNLSDLTKVVEEISPEILFHMAAQPLVIESYEKPLQTFSTNVMGTANILNACRNLDNLMAFVSVTTDKVYAKKENNKPFKENDLLGGNDPYSSSKSCAELVTKSYFKSYFVGKLNIATARSGNVIGGGDWSKDRLIPDLIRAYINKKVLKIRSPQSIRPWQHVLEPLFGYIQLAEKLASDDLLEECEAWNFGPNTNQVSKVINIVNIFNDFFDKPLVVEIDYNKTFPEAENLLLDSTKSKDLLNWNSRFNLNQALENTYNWYNCYLKRGDFILNIQEQIDNYISMGEFQ